MPVLLLTDIFVFLLVGLLLAFGLYAARREHLRAPWRRVVQSRVGIVSLVVLGSYAAIGLLDTVHFHPRLEAQGVDGGGKSSEILSLLDLWLAPLRERQEKTYSAPFATHLHAMETLVQPDGTSRRDYPRLVHGGAHLAAPDGRAGPRHHADKPVRPDEGSGPLGPGVQR
jgi:peptide/nickel transport system permease protein